MTETSQAGSAGSISVTRPTIQQWVAGGEPFNEPELEALAPLAAIG